MSRLVDRVDLAHTPAFRLGARITVRPSTREMVRDDGCVEVLEPRVMQVLVALVRAAGAVVTRDELTQWCWDGRVVGEDAITRVLSRLRRVADGIAERQLRVETVTKVGYRLIVSDGDEAAGHPASPPIDALPRQRPPSRRTIMAVGAATLAVAALGSGWWIVDRPHADPPPAEQPLPSDPETANLYLRARADWASRQSDRINRAIDQFSGVIGRDPAYAPAYAGLADAYILAREFGSVDDDTAFPRARAAADVALTLQPRLIAAKRALGFVQYWWEGRPRAAGRTFRETLALDPDDGQTHFWYGNALTDNGDFAAALHELDMARDINPESIAIQADWAWAQWSIGRRDIALASLAPLATQDAALATPHDALASIYLSERDFPRYLAQFSACAGLRRNAVLMRQAAAERRAFAGGEPAALMRVIQDHAPARRDILGDKSWPAFVASSVGDRPALVAALQAADRIDERWGSAGQRAWIAAAWRGDRAIETLLARRQRASML